MLAGTTVAVSRAVRGRSHPAIEPGQAWDLDHADDGRGYLGPSHLHAIELRPPAGSSPSTTMPRRASPGVSPSRTAAEGRTGGHGRGTSGATSVGTRAGATECAEGRQPPLRS